MTNRMVLPVIHQLNPDLSLAQAALAFDAGADGVFLISHHGQNAELFKPALELKARHPGKLIGVNLLGTSALAAFEATVDAGLDMVWTDTPGVTSAGLTVPGIDVVHALHTTPTPPLFFGSVAFKYQPIEFNPGRAALYAFAHGMLPTTSGSGTGHAPDVEKVRVMSEALGGGPLAVASGMTPENVGEYLPYVTHYLVATGVSEDEHHFDYERLARFTSLVHAYRTEGGPNA